MFWDICSSSHVRRHDGDPLGTCFYREWPGRMLIPLSFAFCCNFSHETRRMMGVEAGCSACAVCCAVCCAASSCRAAVRVPVCSPRSWKLGFGTWHQEQRCRARGPIVGSGMAGCSDLRGTLRLVSFVCEIGVESRKGEVPQKYPQAKKPPLRRFVSEARTSPSSLQLLSFPIGPARFFGWRIHVLFAQLRDGKRKEVQEV